MTLNNLFPLLGFVVVAFLSSCSPSKVIKNPEIETAKLVRAQKIAAEPRGDFYIGRSITSIE